MQNIWKSCFVQKVSGIEYRARVRIASFTNVGGYGKKMVKGT